MRNSKISSRSELAAGDEIDADGAGHDEDGVDVEGGGALDLHLEDGGGFDRVRQIFGL